MTALLDRPSLRPIAPTLKRPPVLPYVRPAERITTAAELDQVFRFRHQVFCRELRFWDPADYSDGRERDDYDRQALHYAMYDAAGNIASALRLIVRGPYPLEEHCELYADAPDLALMSVAEISRVAVAGRYRRPKGPAAERGQTPVELGHGAGDRRAELVIGLYKAMLLDSIDLGLTHWMAAMERSLYRVLRGLGCEFVPMGPEVDYSGPVRPYLADIRRLQNEQCMTRLA